MGAILNAQWETAHAFVGTFTSYENHFHAVADTVWRKSEIGSGASPLSKIGSSDTKYTIVKQMLLTFDDAGTERLADSTGTVEATCAGSPYAGDAQLNDLTTPFYYLIQKTSGGNRSLIQVHESDLYNEAEADAYITANVANWVG